MQPFHFALGFALVMQAACETSPPVESDGGETHVDAGTPVVVEPAGYVVDVDGNEYGYVAIGGVHFTQRNLDVEHYRNGDPVPHVEDSDAWRTLTTGAWCWYQNVESKGATYGRLYNWHAVHDPRGLVPEGWHVPTAFEWATLADDVGGSSVAGGVLRSVDGWRSDDSEGTNAFGFTGLPGGMRDRDGGFDGLGATANFWTADEYGAGAAEPEASFVSIAYYNEGFRDGHNWQTYGMSVRAIED